MWYVFIPSAFLSNSKHFVWHYQREADGWLLPLLCPHAAMEMAKPSLTWHDVVWYIFMGLACQSPQEEMPQLLLLLLPPPVPSSCQVKSPTMWGVTHACVLCVGNILQTFHRSISISVKNTAAAMDVLLGQGLTVLFFNSVQCHCWLLLRTYLIYKHNFQYLNAAVGNAMERNITYHNII